MRKKQLSEKLSKAIYITSITSFLFAISLFIYTLTKSDYVSLRKTTETLAQLENKEEMKREIRKEIEQEINNKKLALFPVEKLVPVGEGSRKKEAGHVSLRKKTETLAQLQNKEEIKTEIRKEIEQDNNKQSTKLVLLPGEELGETGNKSPTTIEGNAGYTVHIKPRIKTGNSVLIEKEKWVALDRLEAERVAKRLCKRIETSTALSGTTGGAVTGAVACTGLLGTIFLDFGLSYATCVAATTAVTTAATAVGHANYDITSCVDVTASKLLEQNKEEKPQTH
jgi:hypothetical protein